MDYFSRGQNFANWRSKIFAWTKFCKSACFSPNFFHFAEGLGKNCNFNNFVCTKFRENGQNMRKSRKLIHMKINPLKVIRLFIRWILTGKTNFNLLFYGQISEAKIKIWVSWSHIMKINFLKIYGQFEFLFSQFCRSVRMMFWNPSRNQWTVSKPLLKVINGNWMRQNEETWCKILYILLFAFLTKIVLP